MNNIMVDLETLDNTPTAVILSIGAVKMDFDKLELGENFYRIVDPVGQGGLTIGADTVRWWMQQAPEAQSIFRTPREQVSSLLDALRSFSAWLRMGSYGPPILWGHGATFDNAILRNAYAAMGQEYPVAWYNDRCYRTMKAVFSSVDAGPRHCIKHNALDDARHQATHLVSIMKRLKGL